MKKICRRCKEEKNIKKFRKRTSGFVLNQCRDCESEMGRIRREKKTTPETFIITTKRGKEVYSSIKPILGGRMTTSPNTDKVLYFESNVNRDTARVAFSTFANIPRTGINYQKI